MKMRKSKLGKNNNEHEKLELNNDLSDIEKGITEDGQILPEESYKLLIESGQAEKISPKASGILTWQLAMSETDNELYLRLWQMAAEDCSLRTGFHFLKLKVYSKYNRQRASHLAYSDRYLKGLVPIMLVFWLLFYARRIYACWRRIRRNYLRMFYMLTGGCA
jgi:hypothetical protein